MPHIRLTISQNAEALICLNGLLAELVELLTQFESVESSAIKAYADVRSFWSMGERAPKGFVHCEVAVLVGRSEELRSRISQACCDLLAKRFSGPLAAHDVGITVEIREMDTATYRKARLN